MKRVILLLTLALLVLRTAGGADAVSDRSTFQYRDSADQFQAETGDPACTRKVLNVGLKARESLGALIGSPAPWKVPILFRVDTRASAPPTVPILSARVRDGGIELQITATAPGGQLDDQILNPIVAALLYEKVFEKETDFSGRSRVPDLPYWLVVGITQHLFDRRHEDFELILKRAYFGDKAPPLSEVLGWRQPPPDAVQQAWQQTFCFYLVEAITRTDAGLDQFHLWLNSIGNKQNQAALDLPGYLHDERLWKAELRRLSTQTDQLIFSWDQTVDRLTAAQSIVLVDGVKKTSITTQLVKLQELAAHPGLPAAVQAKIAELTNLELRAHFAWRPIIARQRDALVQLLNYRGILQPSPPPPSILPPPKGGVRRTLQPAWSLRDEFAITQHQAERLQQFRENVEDYLNWFEVTQGTARPGSAFTDYINVRREREIPPLRPGDPFNAVWDGVRQGD